MKGIIALLFSVFALARSTTNTYVSQALDICSEKGSDSTLVEHEECTKFYICSKGEPVAMNCPRHPTLYYNDDIKACDWPQNVDCGSRDVKELFEVEEEPKEIIIPKEEKVNDDPSEASEICATSGSDSILVAHEECNKFYTCSGGVPIANKCGKNPVLYYNPKLKACDWPENVDCGSRIVETESDENAEDVQADDKEYAAEDNRSYEEKAVEVCSKDDSDGELLAHGDCDKFYMCSEGRPVEFQCPTNPLLFYNTQHKFCDWADSISCGDREIPKNA